MNAVGILESDGYSIEEADSSEAALKLLESNPSVDLLFTDIQMPGEYDGLELARLVHSRWPRIRLVVTSGKVHPMRSEIPDDGRFIEKPYPSEKLLDQVRDLLEND